MAIVAFLAPIIAVQLVTGFRFQLSLRRGEAALLGVALALQILAATVAMSARIGMPLSVAIAIVAGYRILRRAVRSRVPAMVCVAGAVSNLVPIAFVGAMPVSVSGTADVQGERVESILTRARHAPAADDLSGALGALSDWIPVPALHAVVSPGDFLILVGFVLVGYCHLRSPLTTGAVPSSG